MCYDKQFGTKSYAARYGATPEEITYLKEQLNKLQVAAHYHVSGFDHPDLMVITNHAPGEIKLFTWGLIPFFVKDAASAVTLARQTLNARSETIFEKPSFREAVRKRRCLIITDGFFEHHHKGAKTFPYYISLKNGEPFSLAGIWETWRDKSGLVKNTVSIVTTEANSLMASIHNNPKRSSEGPRMPVILPKEIERQWLSNEDTDNVLKALVKDLCRPYDQDEMIAYTVRQLKGKNGVGNTPAAMQRFEYVELTEQKSLF